MTFLLHTWLQALSRKSAREARTRRGAKCNRPHPVVLRLEALEARMVPSQNGYVQMNLVSDLASQNAQITDPNLKNPWGISESASGPFSISDQGANVSTQYAVTAAGVSQVPGTIAFATTPGPHGPTGQVFNDTMSFLVNGTPATTIFANLNGTISAWNSSTGTTAQVVVTTPGAPHSGLDMGSNASGDFLFAANPKQGRIDVFNDSFVLQNLGPSAFVDPSLPAGLVPFNVDNINGVLYVTYAAAGPPAARNSAPEGVGAVAVFDTSGNFIQQVTSGGKLASPWGITLAPSTFGQFGGDLLVGNFSYQAGEINAYDPVSGAYQGTLADENGNTLLAGSQGLWYLTFGNGGNGGLADTLYFTAGLNAETDGLFGAIIPTPENGNSHGSNVLGVGLSASLTNGNLSHSAFVGQPIGFLGGNGLGSGAFNGGPTSATTPSLNMEAGRVVDNGATGGAAGNRGSTGQGIGGGIYLTTGGVADADVLAAIFGNYATASNDDVFGTLGRWRVGP
jgi:uncharacterized protein (TIGR03118 family)